MLEAGQGKTSADATTGQLGEAVDSCPETRSVPPSTHVKSRPDSDSGLFHVNLGVRRLQKQGYGKPGEGRRPRGKSALAAYSCSFAKAGGAIVRTDPERPEDARWSWERLLRESVSVVRYRA